MVHETNKKLLTKIKKASKKGEKPTFEFFPICSTNLGSFPCCKNDRIKKQEVAESDLDKEVGVGITLYFK